MQVLRDETSISVLIPSFRRAAQLETCLRSLAAQSMRPDEVVVVWQDDDVFTAATAQRVGQEVGLNLSVVHSMRRGVVQAENVAISAAAGNIVALLDDDAVAPPDWIRKYKAHYADPTVGAVGGPMMNFRLDGAPFPRRSCEPIGIIRRTGKVIGNMYDLDERLLAKPAREVHHLVGANMTIRRAAFGQFENELREYWQLFETDACLTVRRNGYRVLFDPANPIEHYPTNTAFVGDRTGNLDVKVFNPAFNHALVLGKHMPRALGLFQLVCRILTGSVGNPGLLAYGPSVLRHGNPRRELGILFKTNQARIAGWRKGRSLQSKNG